MAPSSSSSSSSTPHPIPLVYRIVFTYIDPLFCTLGLYTHLFASTQTGAGYGLGDSASSSSSIGTQHILGNLGAFFAFLFVIEGVLLRARARDPTVWRIVQAGGFLLDLVMTVAAVRQLGAEQRLGDFARYTGDDYHHVFGNAGLGLIRLACALGLGIGSASAAGLEGVGTGKGKAGKSA